MKAWWHRFAAHLPPLDSVWVRVAMGLVVIGAVPLQRTAGIHQGYGIRASLLVAIVVAACALLERSRFVAARWWGPFAVAAGTALLGAAASGRIVGLILFVTTLFGAWVAFGHRVPLLPPFDPRSRVPVVLVTWGASRVALHTTRLGIALAWYGLAIVVALVLAQRPELPGRIYRWLVPRLRVVLTVLLLTPLWVLTALLPWVFQRIVGFDPTRSGFARGSSWIARGADPERPDRLWFTDPRQERPSFARRVHARLPFALAAVLVLGIWFANVVWPAWYPPPANDGERALRSTEGYGELRKANDAAVSKIWFSQYAGNEWSDFTSRYLNIRDGQRATWQPEACDPDRLVVWVFGGSTLFGVFQRDDETIPSEVAKEADRRGIPVEVVNWGMVGDVSWQEGRRMERALAAGRRPDVVVFYDGWNDLRSASDMDFSGRGGPTDFSGPMDRIQEKLLSELDGLDPGSRRVITVPTPGAGVPRQQAVALALRQYRTAHRNQQILAEANGIELFRFYQPSLHSRDPELPGEPYSDPPVRQQIASFRDGLPPSVVDLGDLFDDVRRPFFYDEVHTTESANPVIARAIVDELAPTLRRLAAQEREPRPCR